MGVANIPICLYQCLRSCSVLHTGVVQVTHLFWNHGFSDSLKLKYIQLLEKFEVALKISKTQVYTYIYM